MADANLRFNILAHNRSNNAFTGVQRALGRLRGAFSGVQGAVLGLVGIGGLGLLISKSLETADRLGKVAKATGVSVQALQEYQFAARQSGLDTEKMNKGVQTFGKRLGELRNGTGALKTFLDKLGDESFSTLLKNAGSTEEALDLFLRKMAEIPNEADRAALSAAAFSKQVGVDMVNLVSGGVESLEALRAKARELLPISTEQASAIEALNDAFDRFKTLLGNLVTRSLAALAPALERLVNGSMTVLPALFEGTARAIKLVTDNLDLLLNGLLVYAAISIAGVVINQAVAFVKFARTLNAARIAMLGLAAAQKLQRAGLFIMAAVLAVATDQLDNLKRAIEGIGTFVEQHFGGVLEELQEIAEALGFDLSGLTEELSAFKVETGVTASVGTTSLQALKDAAAGTAETFSDMTDEAETFGDTLAEAVAGGTAEVGQLVRSLKVELGSLFVTSTITPALSGLFKGFGKLLKDLTGNAKDLGEAIDQSITDGLVQAEAAFLQFVRTGKLQFSDLIGSMIADLGKLLIQQSIMGPLGSIFSSIGQAAGGFLSDILGFGSSSSGLKGVVTSASTVGIPAGFLPKASGGRGDKGKPYWVGERGPEPFIPDSSGRIIPAGQLGGQSVIVNQSVNVSTGVVPTVRAEIQNMMPQIAAVTKAAVAEATQRGGSFAQAVRAR